MVHAERRMGNERAKAPYDGRDGKRLRTAALVMLPFLVMAPLVASKHVEDRPSERVPATGFFAKQAKADSLRGTDSLLANSIRSFSGDSTQADAAAMRDLARQLKRVRRKEAALDKEMRKKWPRRFSPELSAMPKSMEVK